MEISDQDLLNKTRHLKKPKSLKQYDLEKRVVNFIIRELQKIPDYCNLKLDVGMLQFACSIIESTIVNKSKKGKQYDKIEILLSAYQQLFANMSEEEKETIKSNVEYLHKSNLIKRIPWVKYMLSSLFECFLKHVAKK